MEKQTLAVDLFVAPQMLDPRTQQIARPADDSMNGVAFFQKQLGQIRAVLAGDAGDESYPFVTHRSELITKGYVEEVETLRC